MIDLDPCEVWNETERKARKEHWCGCCRRTIRAGERYVVHFNVFEGDVNRDKICLECFADRAEFAAAHNGVLCMPKSFREILAECISEEPESREKWQPMLDRIRAGHGKAI